MDEKYRRLRERYETGDVPWDAELPPPEVMEMVGALPPGRALDLGCGYGRTAIYLAQHGWQVDGVDFVELALEEAERRAAVAGVEVAFHHSSVTDLHFLEGPFDLAVDVGCGHALDEAGLRAYRAELLRLLRPGAFFLFFARIRDEAAGQDDEEGNGPRGLDEALFRRIFADGFTLYRYERGVTEMEAGVSWRSAWFWLRRT